MMRRRTSVLAAIAVAAATLVSALGLGAFQAAAEPPKVEVVLEIKERSFEVLGVTYTGWVFANPGTSGTIPGPIIRIPQGTELTITIRNGHSEPHSFHTHIQHYEMRNDGSSHTLPLPVATHQADDPLAVTGATSHVGHVLGEAGMNLEVGMNPTGNLDPRYDHDIAPPGGEYTYRFNADEVGTFVYHCHVFPVEEHINHGLYGLIIVYPPGWSWEELEPHVDSGNTDAMVTDAQGRVFYEDVIILGQVDLTGLSDKAGVPVTGETGKVFVTNFKTWNDPYYLGPVVDGTWMRVVVANMGQEFHSWHIHAHNFDVLEKFDPNKKVSFRTDALTVGPGQSYETVLQARFPGFWMVHDHSTPNQYAGMMPWLHVKEA